MCAMRDPEAGDVVDMAAWLQRLNALQEAIEARRWRSAKAKIHDMRTELETRLYREHLIRDPAFREEVDAARAMMAADDNGDRIPGERFLEWAEGIQPTR